MINRQSLITLLSTYFPEIKSSHWEITPLTGLSGGSYLLQCVQSNRTLQLVARANGETQSCLYVDRRKEARILRQLQPYTFAPTVVGYNAQWLLLAWCEGLHPGPSTFLSADFQCQLANTLAQLHCSALFGYRLQLRDEIAHYGYLVDTKRLSPRWKKLHRHFLSTALPKTLKLAPAHMDVHPKNIISTHTGEFMLLDWEYAANTDIAFSLETYFQFNSLTDKQRHFFLMQYCDVQSAYRDKQQLAQHCQLWEPWVKYMTLMWYEVQWNKSQLSHFLVHSQSLRHYFGLLG
nr:thiamine kinase [Providencia rettgeri]ELR5256573.1 thiamine kinase [Providencia rettgeri]